VADVYAAEQKVQSQLKLRRSLA